MKYSISIVSHGQGSLIQSLLSDIRSFTPAPSQIIITLNIPENIDYINDYADLPILLIENALPKGFGDNHNSAFKYTSEDLFIVLNPDIIAPNLDLKSMIGISAMDNVAVVAPIVVDIKGKNEDNARKYPTIFRLIKRTLSKIRVPDYDTSVADLLAVDWVAGMFMLFNRECFKQIRGFDTSYFMYMEDADICRRLHAAGYTVCIDCTTTVIHDARRASHHSFRHLCWHIRSAFRFISGF